MRTIKFRGTTQKGEIVYGYLTHHKGNAFINDKRVDENSVAQFCGLDSVENEVYERDTVVSHGKVYTVALSPLYGLFKNLKSYRKV